MAGVFICKDTDTQREDSHGKVEAEIGFLLPLVKECLRPPEPGRGMENLSSSTPPPPSPGNIRESMALPTP